MFEDVAQSEVVRTRNWAAVRRYWQAQADRAVTRLRLTSCKRLRDRVTLAALSARERQ